MAALGSFVWVNIPMTGMNVAVLIRLVSRLNVLTVVAMVSGARQVGLYKQKQAENGEAGSQDK